MIIYVRDTNFKFEPVRLSWLMESIKIRILAEDQFSPSAIFRQCTNFSFYRHKIVFKTGRNYVLLKTGLKPEFNKVILMIQR